jgi:SM-20-related protein
MAIGEFQPAAIGKLAGRRIDPSVRGDSICWLDPRVSGDAVKHCFDHFERLRLAINVQCYLGLFEFEAHFSHYAAGSHYAKHLDQFASGAERIVSCVLYLNQEWTAEDGGELRLYLDESASRHVDIAPKGGTLITFLSDRFYHEVRPARRKRWSLTGWFRKRSAPSG